MRTPLNKSLAVLVTTGLAGFGLVGLTGQSHAAVPGGVLIYGLTTGNTLTSFRADTPATTTPQVVITGLAAGEDVVGIDVRPANGLLYGLVSGATDRVIIINPTTGASTPVGNLSVPLVGTNFGIDFNPVPNALRIVSDADQNLRITAPELDGTDGVLTVAVDGTLNRAGGADPAVRGAAYTNNVAGASTTALLDYDVDGADTVALQNPPNAGTLTTLAAGPVDVPETLVSATSTAAVGLDIEAVTDVLYALLDDGSGPELFRTAGAASATTVPTFQRLGATLPLLEDIAVASPRFSVLDTAANEGSNAVVTVQRTGDLAATATVVVTPTAATGTATSGSDFDPTAQTATFASGAATATVNIAIPADGATEGVETFTVLLSDVRGSGGNEAVARRQGTVTINDTSTNGAPPVGGGTGTTSPSPGASASPSASASASPSASSSASPSPTARPSRLRISVSPATITPGVRSVVRITGTPGSVIELQAYSRPSTDYRVVRRGTIPASGVIEFGVLPGTNTRLFAAVTGVAGTESPSIVINVRTALSLTVVRNGSRDYTFQGRILPRRAGQLISLYRVTNDGREILTSQLKTDSSGTYRIRRVFTGSGLFGFLTRTGQTLTNAAGVSNGGRARPTAIYAGPQR